jgi:hypothetical protein
MLIDQLSPNGSERTKESGLSPEFQKFVRTEQFKEWFGDWENDPDNASKIVDENGEPLLVYAGLPTGITQLSGEHRLHTGSDELGYYFTKRLSNARGMAEQRRDATTDEIVPSSVYGAFLNLRQPIIVQAHQHINTTRITELPSEGDGYINDKLQEIVALDPEQIAIVTETRIN